MKWIILNRYKIKVYGKKGKVLPKGAVDEHTSFLQSILTNDIINLKENHFNYNLWLTGNGQPKEEFYVYKFKDHYLLDTDARADYIIHEFNKIKLSLQVYFENMTGLVRHLYIFGEGANEFISKTFDISLSNFEIHQEKEVFIARNPLRVGENGYDIIGSIYRILEILNKKDEITNREFEDIRIKNCVPRIHKELREGFHPLEANIVNYAFSLTKGCYVGQEAIARVHFRGKTPRTLAKFAIEGIVRENDKILGEDKPIGVITSINSKKTEALGYILRKHAEAGSEYRAGIGKVKFISECKLEI